ncbi:DUF1574 domain-containing protein [Leptospira ognonensis]|uniref:DUF1574 domain-containing protein n=1 Tax=Leptospira ognonensis TaxID=2484945 RepID=A0A4R9K7A6_9LEPT|nr:DUF1574 family protein [Leptospira ognonensis]TGL61527.1 DUF1574 domain-containing protein [Leptospira ognonensis]
MIILYPLLVCLTLFLFDKIFFLPIVVENTHSWKKIERSFYDYKEDLFNVMLENHRKFPERKVGVILGSSRSGEFDTEGIKKLLKNTDTYNFAAPFGPISFQFYWMERILAANLPISYFMVEVDPLLFTKSAITYSLNGSYDWKFVLFNTDFYRIPSANAWSADSNGFSVDESETFFLKKFFALYKYPIDPGAIKANNKEIEVGFIPGITGGITGKDHKRSFLEKIKEANRTLLGAMPNEIKFANADFFLEKDAENLYTTHMNPYRISLTQISFFKRILKLMKGKDIPVIFYYPVVAPALKVRMERGGVLQDFQAHTLKLIEEYGKTEKTRFIISDPSISPNWTCKDFVDALHLSGACFPNLLPILFSKEIRN